MDITDLTRRVLDRRDRPDAPLRIVQSGHPALRRPALDAVGRLDPELLRELVDAMTLTMREAPGVGVAAPQVGLPLRLFVTEDRHGSEAGEDPRRDLLERRPLPLRAILDPTVEPVGDERVYAWEGCLSVDGWQSIVPRHRRVRLRGVELAPGGEQVPVDEELRGWPARIVQHETGHLHARLCHDLMVPRSLIHADYVHRYEDLSEAVRRLGLEGEVASLPPGEIVAGPGIQHGSGSAR